jgi:hypothetical protein
MLGLPNNIPGANDLTPINYKDNCRKMHYLSDRQKELCVVSENIITVSAFEFKERLGATNRS